MNNSLFNDLKRTSDENYESKIELREKHQQMKDDEYVKRDSAMVKASSELYNKLMDNDIIGKIKERANDGYYEALIFAVSLDPSMDHFASHEPGKPFIVTEFEGVKYTFTYRSLFWCAKWKELFGPFRLNYRWNKPQTLLSVYISWDR